MNSTRYFFQPAKSTFYFWYLVFTHLFALTCIWFIAPGFLFMFFLLCMSISFSYYYCRNEKIIALQHDKKTQWMLELFDGETERAELLSSSVMMRYFLVLHFKLTNSSKKKTLLLFSDSFSKIDFQALRRCVKMGYL